MKIVIVQIVTAITMLLLQLAGLHEQNEITQLSTDADGAFCREGSTCRQG